MNSLHNVTIQRKLTLLLMLTSGVALLLACVIFAAYEVVAFRQEITQQKAALAGIICVDATAALCFHDREASESLLEALRTEPHVMSAYLFQADGSILGEYHRDRLEAGQRPVAPRREFEAFEGNCLYLSRNVMLDGAKLGSLFLQSDTRELSTRLSSFAGIVVGVLVASVLVALLLTRKLQRLISEPILSLAETSRTVATKKDYSVRAQPYGRDELGLLVDAFNEMLSGIQAREHELKRQQERLEEEVAARAATNDQLRAAKEKAEEASRAKSEFLANVSHEIRTPMNGIMGMTELTLETELRPEQREYLSLVRTSANALLDVIDDLLDFSKIEAGKLELDTTEFDLRLTLSDTMKPLALRARQKGLELTWEVAPQVPPGLAGDPLRLRQVLVNLVGNAIKFTDQGEIAVRVDADTLDERTASLHFLVRDTGTGIPRAKQAVIFEAFCQADGSSTRRHGGTGLGLTISTKLVEMMGGRLWVESEAGQGSTFHFTAVLGVSSLPISPGEQAKLDRLRDTPVLVASADPAKRGFLVKLLRRWELAPIAAADVPAATAAVELASHRGNPVRLLLIDQQMPDSDGFESAMRASRQEGPAAAPILRLAPRPQAGEADRDGEPGMVTRMTGPIVPMDLLRAITAILNSSADNTAAPQPHPLSLHRGAAGRTILLAEDNTVNQRLACLLLQRSGFKVVVAGDGREALSVLERVPVDLVLMDVQMPEVGGFEATRIIRERERQTGGHLPIIALTAHALKGDRERCLQAGMDDYLPKPLAPTQLYQTIFRLLPSAAQPPGPSSDQEGESPTGELEFPRAA